MVVTSTFIALILLVFVLVWLFARSIDKRLWVSISIAIVATPFIYFYVFYPFINIFSSYHHKKYFDSENWKEKPALRYEMSENLMNKELLLNKNKQEIHKLLGESEWYGWDDALKANSENIWNYNMGIKPGAFNMTQENLEIVFKDDQVKTVKQYQMEKEFE